MELPADTGARLDPLVAAPVVGCVGGGLGVAADAGAHARGELPLAAVPRDAAAGVVVLVGVAAVARRGPSKPGRIPQRQGRRRLTGELALAVALAGVTPVEVGDVVVADPLSVEPKPEVRGQRLAPAQTPVEARERGVPRLGRELHAARRPLAGRHELRAPAAHAGLRAHPVAVGLRKMHECLPAGVRVEAELERRGQPHAGRGGGHGHRSPVRRGAQVPGEEIR